MRFFLRAPEDGTLYGGAHQDRHEWSIDAARAKAYPTYMQANLAKLAVERAYAGVGFYTVEIIDEHALR